MTRPRGRTRSWRARQLPALRPGSPIEPELVGRDDVRRARRRRRARRPLPRRARRRPLAARRPLARPRCPPRPTRRFGPHESSLPAHRDGRSRPALAACPGHHTHARRSADSPCGRTDHRRRCTVASVRGRAAASLRPRAAACLSGCASAQACDCAAAHARRCAPTRLRHRAATQVRDVASAQSEHLRRCASAWRGMPVGVVAVTRGDRGAQSQGRRGQDVADQGPRPTRSWRRGSGCCRSGWIRSPRWRCWPGSGSTRRPSARSAGC